MPCVLLLKPQAKHCSTTDTRQYLPKYRVSRLQLLKTWKKVKTSEDPNCSVFISSSWAKQLFQKSVEQMLPNCACKSHHDVVSTE